MKKINKLMFLFSILLAFALVASVWLAKAPAPKRTKKKSTAIKLLIKKHESLPRKKLQAAGDFPHVSWKAWGHEMKVNEAKAAAAKAKAKIRIPKNRWGSEEPKIYVQSFDALPVPGRYPYAVVYPNGLEMEAYPEKPNSTLDFDKWVLDSSTAVPADRRYKPLLIHGQKAVGLENGFNIIEGKKQPRPAAVTIYEDGIRYHFYAPIGIPLADLIPLVEETKDLN